MIPVSFSLEFAQKYIHEVIVSYSHPIVLWNTRNLLLLSRSVLALLSNLSPLSSPDPSHSLVISICFFICLFTKRSSFWVSCTYLYCWHDCSCTLGTLLIKIKVTAVQALGFHKSQSYNLGSYCVTKEQVANAAWECWIKKWCRSRDSRRLYHVPQNGIQFKTWGILVNFWNFPFNIFRSQSNVGE